MAEINNVLADSVAAQAQTVSLPVQKSEGSADGVVAQTTSAVTAVETGSEVEVDADTVTQAADQLNSVMDAMNKGLRFRVSDETNDIIVEVVDKDTGEVIRSLPPEDMMKFRERFEKSLGLILDSIA